MGGAGDKRRSTQEAKIQIAGNNLRIPQEVLRFKGEIRDSHQQNDGNWILTRFSAWIASAYIHPEMSHR